jgi:hypothetical protein
MTSYPLKKEAKWRKDPQYDDGKLTWMTPSAFLSRVPPLDEADKKLVKKHKKQLKKGEKMKPLAIYADGEPNGRHRAEAAKELGIKRVPVLVGGAAPAKYPGKLKVRKGK